MKLPLRSLLHLVWKRFFTRTADTKAYAGFLLAEWISARLYPSYLFSEYGRLWLEDREFLETFRRFSPHNVHSADRKYFLRSLLGLVSHLEGDTAECGAYQGHTSFLICRENSSTGRIHHIFDSFAGLSRPEAADGAHWSQGDLSASEAILRQNLASFEELCRIYKGWIPERFDEVSDRRFVFLHIDVDLYQPTLDSLAFFYPRMVPGGVVLSDDYGTTTCPGAKKAFDEFFADKPERLIHVPTGQCFVMKQ